MPELNTNYSPTVQFDLPNALAQRYQLQQRQQQMEQQNALADAVPMLQTDPQNAFSTAAAKSPQAALQLLPYIKQMDDEKKAQAADRADAIGKLAYTLKAQYPDPVIRKAVALSQAPNLAQHGVTPDMLQNFDYSDQNLQMAVNNMQSVKDLIAQSNADRTYNAGRSDHADTVANQNRTATETARHDRATEAQAAIGGVNAWQVLTDPKAGVQYRYNARTGQSTTLDGSQPYTPQGAEKIGSGSVGRSPASVYLKAYLAQNPDASPDDIAKAANKFRSGQSEAGAIGTRSGAADVAAAEVSVFAQQALDASNALPRSDIAAVNGVMQAWDTKTKNPQLRKLMIAADALVNARARAISPTGSPHVNDQLEGRKMLSAAFARGDFEAAVQQMQLEAEGVKSSTKASQEEAFGSGANSTPNPTEKPSTSGWSNFKVHN